MKFLDQTYLLTSNKLVVTAGGDGVSVIIDVQEILGIGKIDKNHHETTIGDLYPRNMRVEFIFKCFWNKLMLRSKRFVHIYNHFDK